MMDFPKWLVVLAPAVLGGCAVLGNPLEPYTPLEARYSGTYEGTLKGLTGESAARLVLDISERGRQASGVLTNLRSNKSYTFSGEFIPAGEGGTLSARLFEKGNRHAANLSAQLGQSGDAAQVQGQVRTVLLGQEIMNLDLSARRVVRPAPEPAAGRLPSEGPQP